MSALIKTSSSQRLKGFNVFSKTSQVINEQISQTVFLVGVIAIVEGCSSAPKVVVDPKSIVDGTKYRGDLNECTNLTNSYDLGDKTAKNAALGAAAGGVAVAGVATAIAGVIFWPAIPFIAAGTLLGGGTAGGITNSDKTTVTKLSWMGSSS